MLVSMMPSSLFVITGEGGGGGGGGGGGDKREQCIQYTDFISQIQTKSGFPNVFAV